MRFLQLVGFCSGPRCSWWIFQKSILYLVDFSKKHFTFGGFLEKALCNLWIFRKSTPQLVDFH